MPTISRQAALDPIWSRSQPRVVDLQEKRHLADYDPLLRVRMSDAISAVDTGRAALIRFRSAKPHAEEGFSFVGRLFTTLIRLLRAAQ